MASPCFSADLQAAIESNSLQRRVDSTQTDESPFGSSLTTPVDEADHPFHDFKALGSGAAYMPYLGPRKGDGATTPPLLIAAEGFTAIQGLAGNSIKSDQSRPGIPTSTTSTTSAPLDEPQPPSPDTDFSVDEADTPPIRQRANSLYNLPNEPIHMESEAPPERASEPLAREELQLDTENSPQSDGKGATSDDLGTDQASRDDSALPMPNVAQYQLSQYAHLVLRVALFLPWCAAVGGAILLFPKHLELVAFGPQYIASPKGIQRFAYWADCAVQHVVIFLASLVAIGWVSIPLGSLIFGGVLAQCMLSWGSFEVDAQMPLGDDDRQSIYFALAEYVFGGGLARVKKTDRGYILGDVSDVSGEE